MESFDLLVWFFFFEARVQENAQTFCIHGAEIWVTILMHPQPQIHVKNSFSGNINTRLGMCKVQLFKLGRHFWIVSIEIATYYKFWAWLHAARCLVRPQRLKGMTSKLTKSESVRWKVQGQILAKRSWSTFLNWIVLVSIIEPNGIPD